MTLDTLPKFLIRNYEEFGADSIAMLRKDYGIWNEYTWKDYHDNVKLFAFGLLALGLEPNDKVAILGDNAPEWFWSALGVQAAGGTPTGIFPDSIPSETLFIVNDSGSVFVVAEDQEQVDKILEVKDKAPQIKKVIYWNSKGMYGYKEDPFLIDFYQVLELGKTHEKKHPGLVEKIIDKGSSEDVGVLLYTSGTTGNKQKGVVCSQKYLVELGRCWCAVDKWSAEDNYLSYLCPAWGTEWQLGLASGLRSGATVCFAEKSETVQTDLREIGPQAVFYAARMWEDLCSTIHAKIQDTWAPFRWMFNFSLKIGHKVVDKKFNKEKISTLWSLLYYLADFLMFKQLRDRIGLLHVKWAYMGGSSVSPDIIRFFHAIGINLKLIYGFTEAGMNAVHRDNDIRPETCGVPLPGHKIEVSSEGEILVTSPSTFSEYYKNPEATKEIFDSEGRIRSGDAGLITADNHLIILGRMKELVNLGEGNRFVPEFLEIRLRFSHYIKDVMVVGEEGVGVVCAIVVVDYENVGKWAEDNHINYTTFADLSQKEEVAEIIRKDVDKVNSALPDWSKIVKFVSLNKEFDADEAELTRTRKLRRVFMMKKYRALIDSIYSGSENVMLEAAVTYRDGRKGVVKTLIKIREVKGAK